MEWIGETCVEYKQFLSFCRTSTGEGPSVLQFFPAALFVEGAHMTGRLSSQGWDFGSGAFLTWEIARARVSLGLGLACSLAREVGCVSVLTNLTFVSLAECVPVFPALVRWLMLQRPRHGGLVCWLRA